MDLLASVRKEGSRGGRGTFEWTAVQSSQHRENYLGHSVMAPVGRWQRGRDLQWYARKKEEDDTEFTTKAQSDREREIQHIQAAEKEALNNLLRLQTGQVNVPLVGDIVSDRGQASSNNMINNGKYERFDKKPTTEAREHKQYTHRRDHYHHHSHRRSRHKPQEDRSGVQSSRKRRRSRSASRSRSPKSRFQEQIDKDSRIPYNRRQRKERIVGN